MTQHNEVTMETIQGLKAKGFTHVQLELKDSGNLMQALVEVIPMKDADFGLDIIPLNSSEILDYFERPSPLARYVINQEYI